MFYGEQFLTEGIKDNISKAWSNYKDRQALNMGVHQALNDKKTTSTTKSNSSNKSAEQWYNSPGNNNHPELYLFIEYLKYFKKKGYNQNEIKEKLKQLKPMDKMGETSKDNTHSLSHTRHPINGISEIKFDLKSGNYIIVISKYKLDSTDHITGETTTEKKVSNLYDIIPLWDKYKEIKEE